MVASMAIRFIHTADWQIGKPFANFPSELGGELAAARLSAISRIAGIARARAAAHVLVAGDIFDSEKLDTVLLRRTLESLKREADVTWLLLPGNHDPARSDGIWDRIAAIGLPANVVVLGAEKPFELSRYAVVLPAPLTSKTPGRDPTEWYGGAATSPGQIRIGLAHGSITGFSSEGESSVNIAPDRAARARLDYLALGDWHGATRIDAQTWYSGTPEPDRYPSNSPGYVLCVTAQAGAPPHVEQVASSQFTWARHSAVLASADDVWALSRAVADMAPSPASTLLKVTLSGSLTLAEERALKSWSEEASGRLRHLDLDTSALTLRATAADLDAFGQSGALREAAEQLTARAQQTDGAVAQRALQKLYAYAADARREAS
jgi:DNA repair exonuclease SbcCD nuclease subunit